MKTAMSPKISEFDGMQIILRPKESPHQGRPHIHVKADGVVCSLSIPELELLAGEPLVSSKLGKLKKWMGMTFPEQTSGVWRNVEVSDQLMQDWMALSNGRMPEKPVTSELINDLIPTPDEIRKLAPKKAKKASFWDRAQIIKVAVAKDKPFILDAEFADGSKKRINIKAMYDNFDGHPIHPFYKRHIASKEFFAKVQFDRWQVWWGDHGEESEIGHQDLYSAGEPK
jgi:hypothetical protein